MRVIPATKYRKMQIMKYIKNSKLFSFPSGNYGFSSNSSSDFIVKVYIAYLFTFFLWFSLKVINLKQEKPASKTLNEIKHSKDDLFKLFLGLKTKPEIIRKRK